MDIEMYDSRTIVEKTLMNSAEATALKHAADEIGISKSLLLRLALMKFLHERHECSVLSDVGLLRRPNDDQ